MKEKKEKKEKKSRFGFFSRKKNDAVELTEKESVEEMPEEVQEEEVKTEEKIKEFFVEPELEAVDYYEFIETETKKMENHKARVAGSWGEKRAARMIRDDSIKLLGIPSRLEPFYSRSFKGRPCFLLLGIVYAVCFILFLTSFAGGIYGYVSAAVSLVGMIVSTAFLVSLYIGYPFAQKLLKKTTSYNVVSTVKAKGEAKKNIIISANYDSKYGNNFKISDKVRFWLIEVSLITIAVFALLVIVRLIVGVETVAAKASLIVISAIFAIPSILILILTFSLSKNKVEENNGLSTSVALAAVRYLIDEDMIKKDTAVTFVAFGGENAGHDGANAFVEQHKDTPMFENAVFINMEDIIERKYFVATTDGVHKHDFDRSLVDLAKDVADELEIEINEEGKNFGALSGYAATAFEKAGVPSVTLVARDKNPLREITVEDSDISDVTQNCFKLLVEITKKILEDKIEKG
ncbi:MAG: M28 family peptidase [Christensenellales bacterium]